MASKILIIGANGFIGRHLVAEFSATAATITAIDRAGPGAEDIGEPDTADRIITRSAPDFVVHAAGLVGSASEAELYDAHVRSTQVLLDAVARIKPDARILIIGSAAEFGPQPVGSGKPHESGFYPECECGAPVSDYGRSKQQQSTIARELAERHDLDLIRIRLFNTLGPGQNTTLVGGAMVERLYTLTRSAADKYVVFDPESVRDFLDVRSIARVIRRLLELAAKNPARMPINVCSGVGTTIAGLAGELLAAANVDVRLSFDRPPKGPTRFVGDCGSVREILRGEPWNKISTFESLRDMWAAHRARVEGQPIPK